MNGKNKPSCVSLFTGGGGLDLGFERAGFDILLCNDILEASRETHQMMRPERPFILEDLFKVSSDKILEMANSKEIDIIIGGSPCQSFSILGRRNGIAEANGLLLFEFLRVIKDIQPRMFLLENVPGLLSAKGPASRIQCNNCSNLIDFSWFEHAPQLRKTNSVEIECPKCRHKIYNGIHEEKGGVLETLKKEFGRLGYTVTVKLLNAVNYGAPQIRKRVFMIGYRGTVQLRFPEKTHRSAKATKGLPMDEKSLPPPVTVAEAFKNMDGLPNMEKRNHGTRVTNRYDSIKPGKRDKKDHTDRLALDVPSGTLLVGSSAGGGRPFIHPTEPRIITVREGARLQAFPDDWVFYGTITKQYRLVGNAVPVKLSEAIAKSIYNQVFDKKRYQATLK